MKQVLHKDDKIAVYGEWRDVKGEKVFDVYVHPVFDGVEHQPRGYWLGSNALSFKPPKPPPPNKK